MKNKSITIANQKIEPGSIVNISLPSANLYTQTNIDLPARVFHGKHAGPKMFIIATIHGDELNSIEIIRRLNEHHALKHLRGTLIIIPVANIFGFILRQRYLPDRRDLNRSFPGSKTGSLAARLANILIDEVVSQCNYGIDLHTGCYGHLNMPQLRVNLDTPGTKKLALAFDVPMIIDAKNRDGSLREAAGELGIPLLVYEGGEALRFNEICIRAGLRGIINVLHCLEMITVSKKRKINKYKPVITQSTSWVRAPVSGLMQPLAQVAKPVAEGDLLATIHDPFLQNESTPVHAPFDGIIISQLNEPLVNEGDAMYHIASIKKIDEVSAHIEELREELKEE